MQKNGAGLQTASSCFWDNSTDGMSQMVVHFIKSCYGYGPVLILTDLLLKGKSYVNQSIALLFTESCLLEKEPDFTNQILPILYNIDQIVIQQLTLTERGIGK